jgi:hypothetical protein
VTGGELRELLDDFGDFLPVLVRLDVDTPRERLASIESVDYSNASPGSGMDDPFIELEVVELVEDA